MTNRHALFTEADLSFDAALAAALPRAERSELEHARARKALLAAAEVAALALPAARRKRLQLVTALAFAATAAAAATVATRFEAARHTPRELPASEAQPAVSTRSFDRGLAAKSPVADEAPSEAVAAPEPAAPPPHLAHRAPAAPAHASAVQVSPTTTTTETETDANPSLAGARFAEAMGAYLAGDFTRADALFEAFASAYPRDARAEDALFLRAEARSRRGDEAGARAAARAYLKRFPGGLRRPEAERLAAEGL